jgi:hypothetical protein
VITVTYTPTFDLLDALIDQDAKRRSVSADQLAVLCEWIAWQLPIGTVRQIGVYADEKLVGLADDMMLGGYTPLESALWSLTAACHARLRRHRETTDATAARIVDALLDVVAIGSKMPTEVFRQEAIARAARIIGGEA